MRKKLIHTTIVIGIALHFPDNAGIMWPFYLACLIINYFWKSLCSACLWKPTKKLSSTTQLNCFTCMDISEHYLHFVEEIRSLSRLLDWPESWERLQTHTSFQLCFEFESKRTEETAKCMLGCSGNIFTLWGHACQEEKYWRTVGLQSEKRQCGGLTVVWCQVPIMPLYHYSPWQDEEVEK